MNYKVNDKEFFSVISLSPSKRYLYLIKKIVDFKEIWSLWDEGWALYSDEENNECIPIWPNEQYAQVCAIDNWVNYLPKKISLLDWINKWIPGMKNDRRKVAAFPTSNDKGIIIEPDRIKNDINKELGNY